MAADWIGINSTHWDSDCGHESSHSVSAALNGSDYWAHFTTETHWFILDLDQSYTISKVRGRSNGGYDPTEVNIYVSDDKENWGDAVATGITSWVDTVNWVEEAVTPKTGRYVKVEIIDTENVDNYLTFGATVSFSIFDVYGLVFTVLELSGTVTAESGVTGKLQWLQELAGLVEGESSVAGSLDTMLVYSLAGLIEGDSAVTGSLDTMLVFSLAGLVEGQSTVSGAMKAIEILGGQIDAQAALTGNCKSIQKLKGSLAAQSVVTGLVQTGTLLIPPEMHAAIIDPYSGGAWLWLIEIKIPGYELIYLARNPVDITYADLLYSANNLNIGIAPLSGDGSVPRTLVKVVQDGDYTLEDKINATQGAEGGYIKIIRAHEDFLDKFVVELEDIVRTLTADSDTNQVVFRLGIPDPLIRKVPLRRYSSKVCPYALPGLFGGPECQYAGEDGTCTGKYTDCYTKGNEVNFGADLGLDPNTARI